MTRMTIQVVLHTPPSPNFQTTPLSLQGVSIMMDSVTASLVEAVVEVCRITIVINGATIARCPLFVIRRRLLMKPLWLGRS